MKYCKIFSKTVQNSTSAWDSKLLDELWAYRTPYKVTTEFIPVQLVYGQEATKPVELEMPSLRTIVDILSDDESLEEKVAMLECIDKVQSRAYLNMTTIQKRCKTYYDSKMKSQTFSLMI